MAWECPQCTAQNEGGIVCEQCGYRKLTGIRLTSAAGKSFDTRINFRIDRRIYKLIESDYRYLQSAPGSYQFELVRDENSETGWSLQTSPGSDLNTLLNDSVCETGTKYPLYDGDVIRIGSKSNANSTAAPLTVSFAEE